MNSELYVKAYELAKAIANSQEIGDSHVWRWLGRDESTRLKFRYELEGFDRLYTKFMSEYGFHGPLKKSSIIRFHDGEEVIYRGEIWNHHGEQERKHLSIGEAIDRHITDFSSLDMDGYLLYGGLMQGILYKELAEALRNVLSIEANKNIINTYNLNDRDINYTKLTRQIEEAKG